MTTDKQEVRAKDAQEIARRAYNAAVDVINCQSLDLGIALAACALVSNWLQGEVDSRTLLGVAKLEKIAMRDNDF